MLDDAGHVGDAQIAQRVSAMAAIVEDKTIIGADDAEEIRAETHRQAHGAYHPTGCRVTRDVAGLQRHCTEEPQIIRGRSEYVSVPVDARPLDGRWPLVKRQTQPKNLVFTR